MQWIVCVWSTQKKRKKKKKKKRKRKKKESSKEYVKKKKREKREEESESQDLYYPRGVSDVILLRYSVTPTILTPLLVSDPVQVRVFVEF